MAGIRLVRGSGLLRRHKLCKSTFQFLSPQVHADDYSILIEKEVGWDGLHSKCYSYLATCSYQVACLPWPG